MCAHWGIKLTTIRHPPVGSRRPHHIAPTRRCITCTFTANLFFAKQQAVALPFHEEPVNNNCIGSAEDRARISNTVEKARVWMSARANNSVRAKAKPKRKDLFLLCKLEPTFAF